jgi:hypothetical protein
VILGPPRAVHGAGRALVKVALLLGAGALTVAPTLAGCNGTFRFDEPAAADAAAIDADGAVDAGPSREPCASDTACGGLRCEAVSGACVVCLASTDCSGALARCDTTLHVCVACLATADCGPRQRCEPTTHRCLDTCDDDDDPCPLPNFVCDRDRRLCLECRTSANCAGSANGSACDITVGRCVECTANASCPAPAPVCDRRTGRCVGCVSSAACGVGLACDPSAQVCRELF